MRLEITGRHLAVTAAARSFAAKRIAHAIRNLNNSAVSAHVVLTKERGRISAEVTLHVKAEHFLHGTGTGTDLQTAINAAVEKVERQVEKLKGKWSGRRRRGAATARGVAGVDGAVRPAESATPQTASANGRRIIRARRYAVKPMSIEDAAAEIGDGTDAVIVFRNSSTDTVTVIYRRHDGHLGLIEPEA